MPGTANDLVLWVGKLVEELGWARAGAAVAPARPQAARVVVAAHWGAAVHTVRLDPTARPSRSTRSGLTDVCATDLTVDDILPHMDHLDKFDADGPGTPCYATTAGMIDMQLSIATN